MKSVKLSITISQSVYDGLAARAQQRGAKVTDLARRILAKAVLDEEGYEPDGTNLVHEWIVIDQARETAKRLCREGRFSEAINRDALKECAQIPGWMDSYSACINGNPYQTGNQAKTELNRKLGRNIREAIGGVVRKDANGNPVKENVVGEFFQKFTLMDSFDPAAVEANTAEEEDKD